MLEPPVSTPTRRMQAKASSRIAWYSTSESVWAGATVIESPVCTPIGSKFSIEQTTTQLSARSRITSSSYSFQPAIERSTRISPIGLARGPRAASRGQLGARSGAMPVPGPAEDEARPDDDREADRSADLERLVEVVREARLGHLEADLGHRLLEQLAVLRGADRLGARPDQLDAELARARRTRASAIARLSAVWPPIVGRRASGRSRSMIAASTS